MAQHNPGLILAEEVLAEGLGADQENPGLPEDQQPGTVVTEKTFLPAGYCLQYYCIFIESSTDATFDHYDFLGSNMSSGFF